MKNAILLHGTGGSPKSHWLPYLKKKLEKQGYKVWVPQLPDTENPHIKNWVPFVIKNGKFSKDTVIVGHSAGAACILGVLEKTKNRINKAVLVSGFYKPLKLVNVNTILKSSYDWARIKKHAKEIIFINSDNDPYGCDDKQGRIMFDKLGGTQIVLHGEGHMGSDRNNQPYKKFPLLVKLID